jgi:preprotein translocase subunit YajC
VDFQGWTYLIIFAGLIGLMFYNNWRTQKRRRDRLASLEAGDRVVTVGGIYGRLTQVDKEEGDAKLEIATGVTIDIALGAVSRKIEPAEEFVEGM